MRSQTAKRKRRRSLSLDLRYSIDVATTPAFYPVSRAEVKRHLKVDHDDDNTYIDGLIAAATAVIERRTARQFINATFDLYMDRFPVCDTFQLPYGNLQSIGIIGYYDENGSTQTFASTNYQVDTKSLLGRVALEPSAVWPSTELERLNAVRVRFTCGYGSSYAAIPQDAKQACFFLIGHWWEHREPVMVGMNVIDIKDTLDSLVWKFRIPELH